MLTITIAKFVSSSSFIFLPTFPPSFI
jgi:hypothetical protein